MAIANNILYPCDTVKSEMEGKTFDCVRKMFSAIKDTIKTLHPEIHVPNTLDCNIAQMLVGDPAIWCTQ